MILKLIVSLLLKKNQTFTRLVKVKGKIYSLRIEKYMPMEKRIKKWEDTLKNNQSI